MDIRARLAELKALLERFAHYADDLDLVAPDAGYTPDTDWVVVSRPLPSGKPPLIVADLRAARSLVNALPDIIQECEAMGERLTATQTDADGWREIATLNRGYVADLGSKLITAEASLATLRAEMDEAVDAARRTEREAVVAWLRLKASLHTEQRDPGELESYADAIANSDHLPAVRSTEGTDV